MNVAKSARMRLWEAGTKFLSQDEYLSIDSDCRELFAVLTAILKSARRVSM